MDVQNTLLELRTKRGISAARLAAEVGVSRQTVYAIEAGTYVPNTAVSLKLARVLEVQVEQIFQLEVVAKDETKKVEVCLLSKVDEAQVGQPLRLCRVGSQIVAVPPEPGVWSLPSADAVLESTMRGTTHSAKATVTGVQWDTPNRMLIAGCDPSASILEHSLRSQGFELLISYQNSSESLELLKQKLVHIAGTHLVDKASGEFDMARVRSLLGTTAVSVYAYALWEEGITVSGGNPSGIRSVADFANAGVRIINREPGSGCRQLLDSLLRSAGVDHHRVNGYDKIARGHLPAARLVQSGEVDCCISTRTVARALGLEFIPLVRRPYHLVIRRTSLKLPAVQALLELLGRTSFRREIEACTGYDMRAAGELIS
jgi:molybdate-binding protein/DNA-binding XRE family transcriptional regulator